MSFDNKEYPNRKDKLKPYYGSKRFDRSCRCHGGCGYCLSDKTIKDKKNKLVARDEILDTEIFNEE